MKSHDCVDDVLDCGCQVCIVKYHVTRFCSYHQDNQPKALDALDKYIKERDRSKHARSTEKQG